MKKWRKSVDFRRSCMSNMMLSQHDYGSHCAGSYLALTDTTTWSRCRSVWGNVCHPPTYSRCGWQYWTLLQLCLAPLFRFSSDMFLSLPRKHRNNVTQHFHDAHTVKWMFRNLRNAQVKHKVTHKRQYWRTHTDGYELRDRVMKPQ